MRVLALLVVVGCTQMPAEKAQDVCQAYCACTFPGALPSTVDQCVAQMCLPAVPPVSDDCLNCVFEHEQSCSVMFTQCDASCFPATQTPISGGM